MSKQRSPILNQHRFAIRLNTWLELLIAPASALHGQLQRHTARLLACLLLTLISLFAIVDITRLLTTPFYRPPWYGYLLFGTAYLLSRSRYYQLATLITLAVFPLLIFTTILTNPSYGLERTVQYLVLSIFLASIFLSARTLALFALFNCTGLLLMPILSPATIPSYAAIVTPLAVNIIGAMLALIVMRHRDQIECNRQAALRASEERYRTISELVSDYALCYRINNDGSAALEWITDAFTRITGYSVAEMQTSAQWPTLVHPDDQAIASQHSRLLLAGHTDTCEYRVIAKNGQVLWLRFYDHAIWDATEQRVTRVYGAVQNITQIKQLEHQLGQAHKLEAIGRLTSSIAHDFNNLLAVILGCTAMLMENRSDQEVCIDEAKQIRHAAEQATVLIRKLLAFSRQQILTPQPLDVNEVVSDLKPLLTRLIGNQVVLTTHLAANLGQVQADPGQLEQVIMNLAINARDAMPTGGKLTITTATVAGMPTQRTHPTRAIQPPCIMLKVSDSGIGMDATTQARIFEPFFTTKTNEQGTGLGLATVYGIVAQSNGQIRVDSTPGHGTTFTIYLPCISQSEKQRDANKERAIGTPTTTTSEHATNSSSARTYTSYAYQPSSQGA